MRTPDRASRRRSSTNPRPGRPGEGDLLWPFTIWYFTSPSTNETATVVRSSYHDDWKYQHEYQKILWRGQAFNKMDAIDRAARETNDLRLNQRKIGS